MISSLINIQVRKSSLCDFVINNKNENNNNFDLHSDIHRWISFEFGVMLDKV